MIDPTISLGIKPPQFADPIEQTGKALNLLAARQQLQMAPVRMQAAQQELEAGRLSNEKAQTAIDEERLFKQAMARGAKPAELLQIAPTLAVPHFKALLDQDKIRLETTKQQTQLFASALGSVVNAPAAEQPARYSAVRADQISRGVIQPQEAPEQYDPAFVDQHYRAAIDADKQVDQHQKQLANAQQVIEAAPKTAKDWIGLVQQQGSAAQSQDELDSTRATLAAMGAPQDLLARALPAMWSPTAAQELGNRALTPEQRRQLKIQQQNADTAKTNAENNVTEAELAWRSSHDPDPARRKEAETAIRRLDQSRLASRPVMTTNNTILPGMPAINAATNQQTGEDYIKTLPAGVAAQVRAIAEGRTAIPSASARTQAAQQIRDAVFRFDPTFSEQRAQVRRAFTTGTDGRTIGALNTAIVHLGRLGDTAEALQNGSFTPGNELYNYFRDKFGSSTVTNFELMKDAVSGEMAAALKGNATDIEIANMKKSLRATNSPEQMRGVVAEGMKILDDKAGTYNERYHAQIPDDPWSPILPTAQAMLARHGAGGSAAALPKGNGRAIDKATAKAFYDAAGGDPGKARQLAQQAGWKVQ